MSIGWSELSEMAKVYMKSPFKVAEVITSGEEKRKKLNTELGFGYIYEVQNDDSHHYTSQYDASQYDASQYDNQKKINRERKYMMVWRIMSLFTILIGIIFLILFWSTIYLLGTHASENVQCHSCDYKMVAILLIVSSVTVWIPVIGPIISVVLLSLARSYMDTDMASLDMYSRYGTGHLVIPNKYIS